MRTFATTAAAILISGIAFNAEALPAVPTGLGDGASAVTLVAGGCGIGWHRGPGGGCRPNARAVVVAPAAPVVVAPAAPVVVESPAVGGGPVCPPGYHLGPRGRACRPN